VRVECPTVKTPGIFGAFIRIKSPIRIAHERITVSSNLNRLRACRERGWFAGRNPLVRECVCEVPRLEKFHSALAAIISSFCCFPNGGVILFLWETQMKEKTAFYRARWRSLCSRLSSARAIAWQRDREAHRADQQRSADPEVKDAIPGASQAGTGRLDYF
jgi:hypothetical protein